MNISKYEKDEINDVVQSIKSKNWAYTLRYLLQWNHAKQFMLLSTLPPDVLQDLHRHAFAEVQYLQKMLYETQYTCDCCVTLLRAKDIYTDVKRDAKNTEFRCEIEESLKAAGLKV